jgi:hypothetical protein
MENDNTVPEYVIRELSQKIDKVEARMDKIEATLREVDKKSSITEILLGRFETLHNKTMDVLDRVEHTMIGMQKEILANTAATVEIRNRISSIEKKFEDSEEKAKVDFRIVFRDFIKGKLLWFLGGGVLVAIIELVRAIIENFDKFGTLFGK